MAIYLFILGTWLALWVVFYGWGLAACRVACCDSDDADALLVNPWIGIALVIAFLQIWHFFAPVGNWACSVACAIGVVAALALGANRLPQLWASIRNNPQLTLLAGALILWLANRSLNDQHYTDQGLYYFNAIRWASNYPLVPGLANLHDRLGFNNSIFLLHAMVEAITGRGYSAHVVNGLMAAMCVPIIVRGLTSVFQPSADDRQVGWFSLGLAMIVISSALDRRISSANQDFAAAMFVTIAAWRLLSVGAFSWQNRDGRQLRWNLLAIAILATAAVTMKATVIFFAGCAGLALVATIYLLARAQEPQSSSPVASSARLLGFMLPWSLVLFIPWVARGYVLSGYPLFPSTIGGIPVDWKLDPRTAEQTRYLIYRWARAAEPMTNYKPGWAWVPDWVVQVVLLRAPIEVVLPAAIAVVSFCWLILRKSKQLRGSPHDPRSLPVTTAILLAFAYCGAILMWFLTAPSPRMGSFAWWGLAATLLGLASRSIPVDWMIHHRRLIVAAMIGLFFLPMFDDAARVEFRYRNNPVLPEYGSHFYKYYPLVLGTLKNDFPPIPQGDLIQQTTNSGVVVNLGKPDAKGIPGLVWDSPLPAGRFFFPNLLLRKPGDMKTGFRIDGESQNAISSD